MEYSLIPRAETVREILALHRETARYGLTLTAEQAAALTQTQRQALRDTGRIQFRGGTLERLIALFCDSPYIAPDEWERTLHALLELFYQFKNTLGETTGDEALMQAMKDAFDGPCRGSLELLADAFDRKERL